MNEYVTLVFTTVLIYYTASEGHLIRPSLTTAGINSTTEVSGLILAELRSHGTRRAYLFFYVYIILYHIYIYIYYTVKRTYWHSGKYGRPVAPCYLKVFLPSQLQSLPLGYLQTSSKVCYRLQNFLLTTTHLEPSTGSRARRRLQNLQLPLELPAISRACLPPHLEPPTVSRAFYCFNTLLPPPDLLRCWW
jgi:hypothetical protein